MKRPVILLAFLIVCISHAQDLTYARHLVDTLTSSYFWGRGYTNRGMEKASDFIAREFENIGLQPLNKKSYKQPFTFEVNTFPGQLSVNINGQSLQPGVDFIVDPQSRGTKAKGRLARIDSAHFIDPVNKIEVVLSNKLTWSVRPSPLEFTRIEVNKKSLKQAPESYDIVVENDFEKKFRAFNVCGWIKGTAKPDSFLVITSHYDHLGGMGAKTFFPGANDDASGTALLLTLAKYYTTNPPEYSIAFLPFAAEEAGLVGSKHFTENPLIPLQKVRFLINLDLVGTGEDGVTVVNGSIFKKEFELLNEINNQKNYLSRIKTRGKAANSDHYWLTEKGVPSFFIYAMGGIQAYHDVFDKSETLPLTEFEDLFKLIVDFNNRIMGN